MTTDPTTEPLRFAYWVPNVSGGLVTSTIEQRTDWSFDYNRTPARLAERALTRRPCPVRQTGQGPPSWGRLRR
jgi:hypothetical protein